MLKLRKVQRGFVLRKLISDQGGDDIDLEVFETSMPGVFQLRLRFHDPDHRFNEHPFLQQHLIRNGYLQGFHILARFVNQVYALLVKFLPKVFGDIPSISVETPMKVSLGDP